MNKQQSTQEKASNVTGVNQLSQQEKACNQALLNQHYQCIQAALQTLSSEQLGMYLHEVRWILKQLGTIMPDKEMPYPEVYRQNERMVSLVDAMQEALTLERARRAFVCLQAMIAGPDEAFADLPHLLKVKHD